jgi:hypothetical protein
VRRVRYTPPTYPHLRTGQRGFLRRTLGANRVRRF